MPSPSPRRAERRGERSAAPGGASAAGVARPSLHATITKIMSESVKLKEAAARFNRLGEQLPTAAADRALCAALLANVKAQIAEDLGEDLGEAAAACGHAQHLEEVAQVCATQAPEMRAPRGARPAKRIQLGAILTQSLRLTGGGGKLAGGRGGTPGGVGARSVFLCAVLGRSQKRRGAAIRELCSWGGRSCRL